MNLAAAAIGSHCSRQPQAMELLVLYNARALRTDFSASLLGMHAPFSTGLDDRETNR
jgi:hypothetical protein